MLHYLIAHIKLNEFLPFGWNEKYITPFQSVDTTILVFDLPGNVKNPCLMVRGETLMGDFFDRNRYKKNESQVILKIKRVK